jgi:hypothetical protein
MMIKYHYRRNLEPEENGEKHRRKRMVCCNAICDHFLGHTTESNVREKPTGICLASIYHYMGQFD